MANLNETLTQLNIIAGKKLQIDSTKVKGEPGTGFEKRGDKGPFECSSCNYFDGSSCGQETMMKLSKQPKNSKGRPVVSSSDCCEYVDRVK